MTLTPYDTGERLSPIPWVQGEAKRRGTAKPDDYGKVDFDNDESSTAATLYIEKREGGYTLKGYTNEPLDVDIDDQSGEDLLMPVFKPTATLQQKVKEVIDNLSTETEQIEAEVYWQWQQALILVGGEKGYRKQQAIMVYDNGLKPSSAIVKDWADGVRDTRVG